MPKVSETLKKLEEERQKKRKKKKKKDEKDEWVTADESIPMLGSN